MGFNSGFKGLKCLLRSEQNFSFYRIRRLHLVFHAVIICFMSQLNLASHYIWCNNIDEVWGETGYLFRPVQGIPLARVVTDTQTCISVLINFVIKSIFRNLSGRRFMFMSFNLLNHELNPICYLLALLGAHHFLHVNRIRVKSLTFRRLMSHIYIYIYIYIYIWSTHSWCF